MSEVTPSTLFPVFVEAAFVARETHGKGAGISREKCSELVASFGIDAEQAAVLRRLAETAVDDQLFLLDLDLASPGMEGTNE